MAGKPRHGMSYSPEYVIYIAAKARCTNPNSQRWYTHGARGIKFLFNSFEEFIAEVGLRPSKEHSLDRWPNNDGNYEVGNLRWATRSEQQKNKRQFTWGIKARKANGKGYYWHKGAKKWMARIKHMRKNIYLGLFSKEKEAKAAYNRALKELAWK